MRGLSKVIRLIPSMPRPVPSVSLPGSGLVVSRLGLGAMSLSLAGRPDRDLAKAVVRRAIERGVTLIDTADVYALDESDIGHNERLVAEAVREAGARIGTEGPGSVVVASKGGRTRQGAHWGCDGRPEHLREACHASLTSLGIDRIPLYQLHTPDPQVPFADSVGALARLREEGKVAAVGLSNVDVGQIREARAIVPVASVQNGFSPWDMGFRRSPVVSYCEREGLLLLAHSPLGGANRAPVLDQNESLRAIGREVEATPAELALAWLLAQAPIVVPIPGARRVESVESSVRAASLKLDPGILRRLERAFRALPGAESLVGRVLSRLAHRLRR